MAASTTTDSTLSRPSSIAPPASRRLPRSRSQSFSSDRPSTIMSHSLMSPPLSVSPEAAFIAASAASQIVTNDHDSHADTWYDQHGIEPAGETALVSPGALKLVNSFLDQLLFNFLQVSRATTLTALRPAVSEVLKPKLAKDAINNADEELREYLGGADEDEFAAPRGTDSLRDWDLELVWKRTRLRCMVYSSLGDMEEEDEDFYTEQENLEPGAEEQGSEIISPAVAIFLTSILEFMGEAALVLAGQAAHNRMRTNFERSLKDGSKSHHDIADRIVVEELDMEHTPRRFSQSSRGHFRQGSSPSETSRVLDRTEETESGFKEKALEEKEPAMDRVEEFVKASAIPLPVGDHDVDEIEVPGLISYSDDEGDGDEEEDDKERRAPRPKSMMIFSQIFTNALPSPTWSQPRTPLSPIPSTRKRSNSLPTPSPSPYDSPAAKRPKVEAIPSQLADEVDVDSDKAISTETITEAVESTEGPALAAEPLTEDSPISPGISDDSAEATAKQQNEQVSTSEVVQESIPVGQEQVPPEFGRRSSKRMSRIIGSTAIASTAVAATAAATTGATAEKPVQQQQAAKAQDTSDGEIDEVEDFAEEPQILTSARVSFAGRSSPSISDSSKVPSINTNIPQRTPSVHSARVIDIVGPKSPIGRSRTPSAEGSERIRPASLSRRSSVHTPPIVEEKPRPAPIDTLMRNAGPAPGAWSPAERLTRRQGTNLSISEAEEEPDYVPNRDGTPMTLASRYAPQTPNELQTQFEASDQPIFGSAVRQPGSPRQEHHPTTTKVTILSTTDSSNAFETSKAPSPPRKSPSLPRSQTDRSREEPYSASHGHTTSIGVVSVERQSPGRESPERARQIHTSGSSGSSNAGKIRPLRTSEEGKGSPRVENVARNFEELIQSDQTIQYTLTPENMRDVKPSRSAQNSPVAGPKSRRSEDVRVADRERSQPSSNTAVKRSGSTSRATGLNSHPVSEPKPNAKPTGHIPRAPPNANTNRSKSGGPQARDARVPRESMIDFADFIRSTGPTGENGPAPLRNGNGQVPSVKNSIDSRRVSSNSNRPRLQARDAAVDSREDNSDLIDFIRRGPPSSHNNPRIPRHVAPFRSTMDSDQMTGAIGGKAIDASLPNIRYSQASTNVTDVTMPSVQSSVNSQSALIKNNRQNDVIDEEDFMPKRTQRRVKDPYAIDFSDEDEDDLDGPPKPPQKQEESLADFLRNYQPPPEPVVQTPLANRPKKKASAPSLIGRFTRGINHGSQSQAATNRGAQASLAEPRSSSSRQAGGALGHTPIQVSMPPGYDQYGPIDGTRQPATQSSGRVPMKKYEPREASSAVTRTSDLASFLRDSEPPPQLNPPSLYSTQEQSSSGSGFSKMFGRRKKSSMA
ncbi:hypothetical protein HYQ45_011979 [Verticillium longisporum]|uniref:Uncharacterized protein n=1 Tax=Verticillium longisporum TaxID=100787 RepID=A0A8I3AKN5_VERLO|nr:hypothetical protein HYQ45_011979 [Verticillium longisporum]